MIQPPTYQKSLTQAMPFVASVLQGFLRVDALALLGFDRFLTRGRSLHVQRQSALVALDVWPRSVQAAAASLCAFVDSRAACPNPLLENAIEQSKAYGMGRNVRQELTGGLEPFLASASQVLYALLVNCTNKALHVPLSNALEYALWVDECEMDALDRNVSSVNDLLARRSHTRNVDDVASYAAFVGGATPKWEMQDAWEAVDWLLKHMDLQNKTSPAHPAHPCLTSQARAYHVSAMETLFLVRALAASLEASPSPATADWALRMRALALSGVALDISYMKEHARGVVRESVAQSEALVSDIWKTRVLAGLTYPERAEQLMHETLRAATRTVFHDFFSLRRVTAMTATAAAALVCDLELMRLADAHSSDAVRALVRPTLWTLYPLIAVVLQRAQDAAGVWPRFNGLFITAAGAARAPTAATGAAAFRSRHRRGSR